MSAIIVELARLVTGCFLAYLILLALIVLRTGSSAHLIDAGRAVRDFVTALTSVLSSLPRNDPPAADDDDARRR